jgi:hypothetical protein
MRDVVIVFSILLVLLLLISTFGGSIRYNMPAARGPATPPMFSPMYSEPFAQADEDEEPREKFQLGASMQQEEKDTFEEDVPSSAAGPTRPLSPKSIPSTVSPSSAPTSVEGFSQMEYATV